MKASAFLPVQKKRTNIIISAYGRGGSTWLEAMLKAYPNVVSFYEPLSAAYQYMCKDLNFGQYHYLKPQEKKPKAINFFKGLFSQKKFAFEMINNFDRKVSLYQFRNREVNLFKFIRLNTLLPWLENNLIHSPTILLLRHPCAVVNSQINYAKNKTYNGSWTPNDKFEIDSFTQNGFDKKDFAEILSNISSNEERLAAWWSINTKIALEQCKNTHVVFYENLLESPRGELSKIFKIFNLDIQYLDQCLSKSQTPSPTSLNSPSEHNSRLEYWTHNLSQTQITDILSIVNRFGLGHLYNESISPLVDESFRNYTSVQC
ncbi:sulfotransferase domain-containing protein [Reichenbachiella ulvae]|uniref:Sulfotransferase domain-containing protein n=1 Tax=Reichenbachiella ulvae TaxID=2980104 RepID=A0ABT3CZ23_9BACT|nr:sulfotransferase domain-containing protein [Reichenbachiella ulvae]MCV9388809.1 sulfotransferase domain-containing protein [Reichenbachiella ulvae]